MPYTSVISEAWKLFKDGRKFLLYELLFSGTFVFIIYLLLFLDDVFTSVANSTSINRDYAASGEIINILIMMFFFIIGGLLTGILEVGIYKGLVGKYLNDKLLGFLQTFKFGIKPFIKVFIASILASIPIFVLAGFLLLIALLLGVGSYSSVANSGSNLYLVGIVILVLCCSVLILLPILFIHNAFLTTVQNAILIDNKGIIESLSYSFHFTKKHFGKLIVLLLIALLLSFIESVPTFGFSFLGEFLQGVVPSTSSIGGINIVRELINLFTQTLISIFSLAFGVYFYCYWIVAYIKLKKIGEVEVKTAEPVVTQA